jgi:hypothetical protein
MARKGSGSSSKGRSKGGSKSNRSRSNSSSNGRKSSGKKRSEREFPDYSLVNPDEIEREGPDVIIDVPVVKTDEIDIEVDQLRARVAVLAQVGDLVQLSVGAEARLGEVNLKIEGVEAQALLKARLDEVGKILDRVLLTLDRNPELLESVGAGVEKAGEGAQQLLGDTGQAVEDVGEGAGGAVQEVGQGAGQAVGDVGQGAGQAVGDVGQGAGQAVGQVGQGAGRGVAGVGQGAQQATGGLAQGGGQGRE